MTRILKKPEERKAEILNVAAELFQTKGYEATTTADILEKAGIARGTLYYYFKSKDEVMDAVIERRIDEQIRNLMPIVQDSQCNALEKLKRIIYENRKMNADNEEMVDYLHTPENIVMHQKSLTQAIKKYAPVLSKIIRQGVEEKLFQTEYPLELAEFLLVGMNFLLDLSIFNWSQEELKTRIHALTDILETTLRAEKGSFEFFTEFAQEIKN
ncbi:MAG: TetR/AcrR family transcriptional regulator [Firmicutes bacterium]|nr:TetR/AcrR family transcriptional regulator [Bacillota bacterium]